MEIDPAEMITEKERGATASVREPKQIFLNQDRFATSG